MAGQSLRVLAGFLAMALQTLQLSIAYVMAIGRLYSVSVCYNSGAGEVASSAPPHFTLYTLQLMATTYKTVLFRFDGNNKTLERGLTLHQAQKACKHSDSSSRTCTNRSKLERWGDDPNSPWFIGYTEE